MQLDESTPLTSDINTTTQKILAVQLSFIDQTHFAYNSIKLYFSDGFLVKLQHFLALLVLFSLVMFQSCISQITTMRVCDSNPETAEVSILY